MMGRLVSALTDLGYELNEIPASAFESEPKLVSTIKNLIIVENRKVLLLTSAGHLLDKMSLTSPNTKNVCWAVDHPSYHYNRFILGDNTAVITANPSHRKFIENLTPAKYLFNSISCVTTVDENSQAPEYDYLVAASWMGEPDSFWDEIQDENLRKIAKFGVDILLKNELLDCYEVFDELFTRAGIEKNSDNKKTIAALCMQSDLFIRKYSRIKIISSLIASGRKVLFVGQGWPIVLSKNSNVTLVADLPFQKVGYLVPFCRYVLNLNAPNGASERVSLAFQNGRPVVSQMSMSMKERQREGAAVRTFSLNESMENLSKFFKDCPNFYYEDRNQVLNRKGVVIWSDLARRLDNEIWMD